MIAASSSLPSAATANAHRTDGPTAPATSGTGTGAKAGSFWSLLGDYLEDDDSPVPAAPDHRSAADEKHDREGQSVPVAVPVLEAKPEIPILAWGLASRETADAKAGAVGAARTATVNLHGSPAESMLENASPEEAALQNPQGDPGAADGVSDLAFAARMFQSDSPQASDKTLSAGAPGVTPATAAQAPTGLPASPESLAETAANQPAGPASPASPTEDSQLAVAATKAALPSSEDSRNQNAHAGQPDANVSLTEAPPGAADRDSPTGSAAGTRETGVARAVEPELPPAPPVSHGVSLRLGDGENNVDIRLTERAGEIRVTVHTPDGNLANSMRSELPDLVGKLRQTGYQAETWRPAAPPQTDGERRSGADGSPQQHSAGSRREGRQQQQQQQQNQPRWVGEWNTSLDPGQETSK